MEINERIKLKGPPFTQFKFFMNDLKIVNFS